MENRSNGSCSGLWDFSALIMQMKTISLFLWITAHLEHTTCRAQCAAMLNYDVNHDQLTVGPYCFIRCAPLMKLSVVSCCTEKKINTRTSDLGKLKKAPQNLENHQTLTASKQTNTGCRVASFHNRISESGGAPKLRGAPTEPPCTTGIKKKFRQGLKKRKHKK